MLGAIVGDIIGSRFERQNYQGIEYAHKSKDFELFTDDSTFTDDTVCTCAIAQALLSGDQGIPQIPDLNPMTWWLWKLGKKYVDCGFGGQFTRWIKDPGIRPPPPFQSWGNGSAMRVSPIGWLNQPLRDLRRMAEQSAMATHDETGALLGTKAVVHMIWLTRNIERPSDPEKRKHLRDVICQQVASTYYPDLADWDIETIRPTYPFTTRCSETVPVAIQAFRISDSFEECIRTAISVGGDSDTLAAIAGSLAHAYYPIPDEILYPAMRRLPADLLQIVDQFCHKHHSESARHIEALPILFSGGYRAGP